MLPEGRATARHPGLHRAESATGTLGGLLIVEAFDVDEHDRRPKRFFDARQRLLDRVGLFDPFEGSTRSGVRFVSVPRIDRVVLMARPPRLAPRLVPREVQRDREQPGAETATRPRVEVAAIEAPVDANPHFLAQIARGLVVTGSVLEDRDDPPRVALDQGLERRARAAHRTFGEGLIVDRRGSELGGQNEGETIRGREAFPQWPKKLKGCPEHQTSPVMAPEPAFLRALDSASLEAAGPIGDERASALDSKPGPAERRDHPLTDRDQSPGEDERIAPDLREDSALDDLRTIEGFKVCGPCVLYREIAAGGMGKVYRARHLSLLHDVAVKCMHGHLASILPKARERFFREARLGASLNHPNLVTVHDVGEHKGLVYMVMEWVEGEDLHARMKRLSANGRPAPRPAPEIRAVGDALAQALEAVHTVRHADGHGLLHRDVKPGNLLLSSRGEFKLADLGLARPLGESEVSIPGQVFGTPGFMPPEQAAGRSDLTPGVDVYAFGMTLFYLGTAQLGSETDGAPVFFEGTEIPPDIARIIDRCTARDPQDRYQDGVELLAAWREITGGKPRWGREDLPPGSDPAEDPARPDDPTVLSIAEIVELPDLEDSAIRAVFGSANESSPEVEPTVVQSVGPSNPALVRALGLLSAAALATFALLQWAPWATGEPASNENDALSVRSGDGSGGGPESDQAPSEDHRRTSESGEDSESSGVQNAEQVSVVHESRGDVSPGDEVLEQPDDEQSVREPAPVVSPSPPPSVDSIEVRNASFERGPESDHGVLTGALTVEGYAVERTGLEVVVAVNESVDSITAKVGEQFVEGTPIEGGSFELRLPFDRQQSSIELALIVNRGAETESTRLSRLEVQDELAVGAMRYDALQSRGSEPSQPRLVYSLQDDLRVALRFGPDEAAQIFFVRIDEGLMAAEAELSIAAFEAFLHSEDGESYRSYLSRFTNESALLDRWLERARERSEDFSRGGLRGVPKGSLRYTPMRLLTIEEALGFAAWLDDALEAADPQFSWEVSIPTLAEWGQIAHQSSGQSSAYDPDSIDVDPMLPGDLANMKGERNDRTSLELARKGDRRHGVFGLFHLIGNVAELCLDAPASSVPDSRAWQGWFCGGHRRGVLQPGQTPRPAEIDLPLGRALDDRIGVRLILRRT